MEFRPPRISYLAGQDNMRDFRKLRVWRQAMKLTVAIHEATRSFPSEERYGLTAQIRAAAASVCANVAEGCGRSTPADFKRFLDIALGSASELLNHLMLARALRLLHQDNFSRLYEMADHNKRMLATLILRVRPVRVRRRKTGPEKRPGAGA